MNECHFTGTLVSDPDVRTFAAGSKKVRIRLAINKNFKKSNGEKGQKTAFADFEAWDTGADLIAEHFRKGDSIIIANSSLEQDEWEKEGKKMTKLYFRINHFEFPRGRKDQTASRSGEGENNYAPSRRNDDQDDFVPAGAGAANDNDIPF